jgi:hypothetical protein
MDAWRVKLDFFRIRFLCFGLAAANLFFTAGTALFIHYWARREYYGPSGRLFIDRILVQVHLATENVVAAWYSSMLLLSVAAASGLAFAVDRRAAGRTTDRALSWGWLIVALAFATLSLDELGSFHERIGMIRHGGAAATGWVYVLVVPIAMVGLFMLAFSWARLRRVPAAAALFAAGTALFLSDPVFELAEMSLLRGGADGLVVHNVLLVIEEGFVELGGALCFLTGVLIYVRGIAGDGPHVFHVRSRRTSTLTGAVTVLMIVAIPLARWIVDRLPPADTGIPEDWFPAAMLFLLSLWLMTNGRRTAGVLALGLSACFGAGLYGYVGLADARLVLTTVATAAGGCAMAALLYGRAGSSTDSAQHSAPGALRTEH